jgi:hypothetical protein
LFEFCRNAIFCREEEEREQGDSKCNSVCHQKGDREIHVRWRALGNKMIERAGTNGEGDGEVKEEHGFGSWLHSLVV